MYFNANGLNEYTDKNTIIYRFTEKVIFLYNIFNTFNTNHNINLSF